MLKLKKYIQRVKTAGVWETDNLRAMLPSYGDSGIKAVADVLTNPNLSILTRVNALQILGLERTNLPNGLPFIMSIVENVAETAPPDLDLMCFVSVYANGARGREEAIALVERFRVGTERQQAVFKATDTEFLRGLHARQMVMEFEAQRNQ